MIDVVTECSQDFFLDNSSGLCRPECGEWDQYSPATRRAVYGVNITFALLTIIVCVVAIVWSIFRHKIMWAITKGWEQQWLIKFTIVAEANQISDAHIMWKAVCNT